MSFVAKSVYLLQQYAKDLSNLLRLYEREMIVEQTLLSPFLLPIEPQPIHDKEQRKLFMHSVESYTILGLISSLYAVGLNTKVGKKFTEEYTWATVCIGTTIVLAVLRLMIPKDQWYKLMTAFTVAGVPMVARSLYNKTVCELQHNKASY